MKYLILRKRRHAIEDPFTEMVGAGDYETRLPFDASTADLKDREAADVRKDPNVEDMIPAIPYSLIEPFEADNPVPPAQWGLAAVGAVECPYDGSGVVVAVLDTGIDKDHPAFSGVTLDLMDFTGDQEEGLAGAAPDTHGDGHGTHVAGIIFGRDVDGTRIGVARGVTKALIGKVIGVQRDTERLYNAIEWALKKKADVICMSLGFDFPKLIQQRVEEGYPLAIAAARALAEYRSNIRLFDRLAGLVDARVARGRGALLVAAAGNESKREVNPAYTVAASPPASADGFLAVGSVRRTDASAAPLAVSNFSNTGCHVAAPGDGIQSARLGTSGLIAKSGTSMAAPHVAGLVALWTQRLHAGERPARWAEMVRDRLKGLAALPPGLAFNDVGLGIPKAPRKPE